MSPELYRELRLRLLSIHLGAAIFFLIGDVLGLLSANHAISYVFGFMVGFLIFHVVLFVYDKVFEHETKENK